MAGKHPTSITDRERTHHTVDASGIALGRLSTSVAHKLRGKHKASFAPHLDDGDFVTIINAEKVLLTGRKLSQKEYHHYSGYPGGVRTKTMKDIFANDPTEVLRRAIYGMLPRTRLRKLMMNRLTIVKGEK